MVEGERAENEKQNIERVPVFTSRVINVHTVLLFIFSNTSHARLFSGDCMAGLFNFPALNTISKPGCSPIYKVIGKINRKPIVTSSTCKADQE